MNPTVTPAVPGAWERSKSLVRSSLRILKKDKHLMRIPLLGILTGLVIFLVYGAVVYATSTISWSEPVTFTGPLVDQTPLAVIVFLGVSLLATFQGQFFAAALVAGILMRLRGEEPSVAAAFQAARTHIGSIFAFSAFSMTVGMILNTLQERLPLGGKIAAWLAGAAWSVASMFAIPVIVTAKGPVGPLKATRQSVDVIKKTWGENLVARLGVGILGGLAVLGFVVTSVGIWIATVAITSQGEQFAMPMALFVTMVVVTVLGLFGLVFVINMLNSIIKAAVFHYGITGEAPAEFEERIIKSSFTQKQARALFS